MLWFKLRGMNVKERRLDGKKNPKTYHILQQRQNNTTMTN